MQKYLLILTSIILISCESLDQLNSDSYSGVATLDRQQVKDWDCVYLYNTNKTETGWSTSSATANAIGVLKKQAMVAKGNAIVITDIYPTSEWNNNGYEVDAAGVSVEVYNCPFTYNSSESE